MQQKELLVSRMFCGWTNLTRKFKLNAIWLEGMAPF